MLFRCIALLAVSVIALAAASCAHTAAAMAGAEATDVATAVGAQAAQATVTATTQASAQVVQQANQIVTNVENGATVASQQILPVPSNLKILIVETPDAWVIVGNGAEQIVFKPSAIDKYDKLKYGTR